MYIFFFHRIPACANDETFIVAQEANELLKQGWMHRDEP
jgi:hypothetical protein